MMIRSGGAAIKRGQRKKINEHEAASRIQAMWRWKFGRKSDGRVRHKPLGYYTHALGLAYDRLGRGAFEASGRRALYLLLEDASSSQGAQIVSLFIISTIIVSIAAFILESDPWIYDNWSEFFLILEVVCTSVFTLEYLLRWAVCDQGGISRCRFLVRPMNVCDLLSVAPVYAEVFLKGFGADAEVLRAFRVVRLIRIVRMVKLGRYASGMRLMAEALMRSSQAISVLVFLLCLGVVLFSSALFHVERLSCADIEEMTAAQVREYEDDCADHFFRGVSPRHGLCCNEDSTPLDFPSIIGASWWSMVTMTSVGYGEVFPRTTQGKCVGFIAMLAGVLLITLPVSIVGQMFQDVYESNAEELAKAAAQERMKVAGENWSLMPASDVVAKLQALKIKDPAMASHIAVLTSNLENIWENREQLMRERKINFEKQDAFHMKMGRLTAGMKGAVNMTAA